MKLYLSLLLLMPSMQAMHNQIMPIENDSHQSDQAVVNAALPSDSPVLHPKLVPLVAANIRSYSNPEASAITKAVVLAANDALGDSVADDFSVGHAGVEGFPQRWQGGSAGSVAQDWQSCD